MKKNRIPLNSILNVLSAITLATKIKNCRSKIMLTQQNTFKTHKRGHSKVWKRKVNSIEQSTKELEIFTYDCDNPSQHNEGATIQED